MRELVAETVANAIEATVPATVRELVEVARERGGDDGITYSEGGTDETGAPVARAWDTWTMYVSSWDKPSSVQGGKSDAWGFSTSHVLAGLAPQKANLKGSAPAEAGKQKWIIHVHRTEAGAIKAATVQWADLEGAGGEKSTLTAKQLTRIGVPKTVDWKAKTASGENKVPGVYKYQRFSE